MVGGNTKTCSICHIISLFETWQDNTWIQGSQTVVDFFNLDEVPKMHWMGIIGWVIVKHMHDIVLKGPITNVVLIVQYVFLTCYEMNI
jgi:hypothetical protein